MLGQINVSALEALVNKYIGQRGKVEFEMGMAIGWINEARKKAIKQNRRDMQRTAEMMLKIAQAELLDKRQVAGVALLSAGIIRRRKRKKR